MKKLAIVTAISVLLNIILIYLFVFRGDVVRVDDERVHIRMSAENRDFALQEMRGFLESVRDINRGIVNRDTALIIEASKRSGSSIIHRAPEGILRSLPADFKELGFGTHFLFDEIGEAARNNFSPAHSQQQLVQLLDKCTACHRSYKIVVSE